jgi:CHAT domain-containing protein/tetratricopeptide (TPR) repeat protein
MLMPAAAAGQTLSVVNGQSGQMHATGTPQFSATLNAGHAYLLEVEQGGLDLIVTIVRPDGSSADFNAPLLRASSEFVLLEPRATGKYVIQLHSEEYTGAAAVFAIELTSLDGPSDVDIARRDSLRAMTRAARAYSSGGDIGWQESLTGYQEALKLAEHAGDRNLQARAHLSIANLLYWQLTDWSRSIDAAKNAASLYAALADEPMYASAIHLQALGLIEMVNELPKPDDSARPSPEIRALLEGALELFREARMIETRLGNRYELARVINDIGIGHYYVGDWDEAKQYFEQAAAAFRSQQEWGEEFKPMSNIGIIAYDQGQLAAALSAFSRVVELLPPDRLPTLRAGMLDNMASAQRAMGQIDDALASYAEALELHETLAELKGQGRSLSGIGVTYYSAGELELARQYLERALPLRHLANDGRGEVATLRYLGAIHLEQGNVDAAIAAHREAATLATSPADRSRVQVLLGRDFARANRTSDALRALALAIELAESAGAHSVLADALMERGALQRATGEYADANSDLVRAQALYDELGIIGGAARVRYELAGLEFAMDRLSEAAELAYASLTLVERQRSEMLNPELRAAYLGQKQDYYDLYIKVLVTEYWNDRLDDHLLGALETSERSRARTFADLLAEAAVDVEQDLAPKWREQRERLQQSLAQLRYRHERLLEDGGTSTELAEVLAELNRTETEIDLLEVEIRRTNPRYAALTAPHLLTARDIQALLDDDSLLLQFTLGQDASYVFAVTRKSVAVHELPQASRLEDEARRIHDQLRVYAPDSRAAARLDASLAKLGALVLGPVAAQLEAYSTIILVADGALNYIPFAALRVTPDAARPLLETHEVNSVPSISTIAAQRLALQARAEPKRTVAIFADPVFSLDDPRFRDMHASRSAVSETATANRTALPRLAASAIEAQTIAHLVAPDDRLVASGFAATRQAVLGTDLSDYRVVHFATHGLIDTRYPALSALALSSYDTNGQMQQGLLRLQDIYSLRLNASLAVLSACDTALGREVRGEGLIGLTRGFLHAGAQSVVATLWQVPDRATGALMERFYRGLIEDGLQPVRALRAAQLGIRSERRWANPHFWAAFVVQGDWQSFAEQNLASNCRSHCEAEVARATGRDP